VKKDKNSKDPISGWDQNKHHIRLLKILTQNRFIKYEIIGIAIITISALIYFLLKH